MAKLSPFADDISLSVSSSDPDKLELISFYEPNNVVQWFEDKLLFLNSGKTELINFCHGERQ